MKYTILFFVSVIATAGFADDSGRVITLENGRMILSSDDIAILKKTLIMNNDDSLPITKEQLTVIFPYLKVLSRKNIHQLDITADQLYKAVINEETIGSTINLLEIAEKLKVGDSQSELTKGADILYSVFTKAIAHLLITMFPKRLSDEQFFSQLTLSQSAKKDIAKKMYTYPVFTFLLQKMPMHFEAEQNIKSQQIMLANQHIQLNKPFTDPVTKKEYMVSALAADSHDRIVAIGIEGQLRIYDKTNAKLTHCFEIATKDEKSRCIQTISFGPMATHIALGCNTGHVLVVDLKDQRMETVCHEKKPISLITWNNGLLCIGTANGKLLVYDDSDIDEKKGGKSFSKITQCNAHKDSITFIHHVPDYQVLLTGSTKNDPTIKVWNLKKELLKTIDLQAPSNLIGFDVYDNKLIIKKDCQQQPCVSCNLNDLFFFEKLSLEQLLLVITAYDNYKNKKSLATAHSKLLDSIFNSLSFDLKKMLVETLRVEPNGMFKIDLMKRKFADVASTQA